MWIRLWVFNEELVENPFLQKSQTYGLGKRHLRNMQKNSNLIIEAKNYCILFSCVDSQVPLKKTWSVKMFPTSWTRKRPSVAPPLPLRLCHRRRWWGEVLGRRGGTHGGEAEWREVGPLGRVEVGGGGGQGGDGEGSRDC